MSRSRAPTAARVREALLPWFRSHARDLPWRRTRDPWAVWVSEVMLQQTRVDTVIPYFERFLARFATPRALAEADEADVLAAWSGLGYYRRARFLHAGARHVVAHHGGVVPSTPEALGALPGVGDYTRGAIGSIAFGLRLPLIDGNVERVLTRVHGLRGNPRAAPLKATLWSLAAEYSDHPTPGDVNQSLMELGATVCARTAPRCLVCPLRALCVAAREGDPERYPEKASRKSARTERWHCLVATHDAAVWLSTSPSGRWQGMLLPLLFEGEALPTWPSYVRDVVHVGALTHVLTHARMEVSVHHGVLQGVPPHGTLVAQHDLPSLAVPRLTERILALVYDTRRKR